MSADCIFCRIATGEVPAEIVHQDNLVLSFRDMNPQAPTHLLVIPRKHIPSLRDLTQEDQALVGHMVQVGAQLAESEGIGKTGFRLVANCGRQAGQSVDHVHFHLLGGRAFDWPPG
jgi:histidine triad (HIT) family protein